MSKIDVEAALRRALAADLSPEMARVLDQRVGWAMGIAAAARSRRPDGRRVLRVALRPAVALLATLVFAGVAVGGASLLAQLAAPVPGFQVAWDRGTPVGLAETANGYTVTLERAYADANQVVLGISARSASGDTAAAPLTMELVDATGRRLEPIISTGTDLAGTSAALLTFDAPRTSADPNIALTLSIPTLMTASGSDVSGPWTFVFRVPFSGGTSIAPTTVGQGDGFRLVLERMTFSPTMISGTVLVSGPCPEDGGCALIGQVRRGERSIPLSLTRPEGNSADGVVVAFHTVSGVDDPAGNWVLVVDEIVADGVDAQVRLAGPWTLAVSAP